MRLRAPTADREVLAVPHFDAVPKLIEENHRKLNRADVTIGGLSLRELRALARREVMELVSTPSPSRGEGQTEDVPLLIAGHQPELAHPGVWAKHFALNGLARKVGGVPLNLVVDNDTLKSTSLRLPVFQDSDPRSVHLESVAFDTSDEEVPYENRMVRDPELFRTFPARVASLTTNWGYEPLLKSVWYHGKLTVGDRFTGMRVGYEKEWGCENRELSVSRLSQTEAFAHFARHVLADLPRFRDVYNAAIRSYRAENRVRSANHPAPELADGEAPFWIRSPDGRRQRATATSDPTQLRPRALTLTLFARVCLGDFFVHGIGGGKYDEVTDAIIRDYFGIDPPAYQILSATLHLPLPGFPATAEDVREAERVVRDVNWNPQRHLTPSFAEQRDVQLLVQKRAALAAAEPPRSDRAARRNWYRELQSLTTRLRAYVGVEWRARHSILAKASAESKANAILKRRDYSWVLYPEETLRPFLQQFLHV